MGEKFSMFFNLWYFLMNIRLRKILGGVFLVKFRCNLEVFIFVIMIKL